MISLGCLTFLSSSTDSSIHSKLYKSYYGPGLSSPRPGSFNPERRLSFFLLCRRSSLKIDSKSRCRNRFFLFLSHQSFQMQLLLKNSFSNYFILSLSQPLFLSASKPKKFLSFLFSGDVRTVLCFSCIWVWLQKMPSINKVRSQAVPLRPHIWFVVLLSQQPWRPLACCEPSLL